MRPPRNHGVAVFVLGLSTLFPAAPSGAAEPKAVDFRYAPPQWQSTICLPDDPHKTLVDKGGELLYHFGKGKGPFGTRVFLQVTDAAVWQKQELHSPRVPIVKTYRTADGLSIVEEAMAVAKMPPGEPPARNDLLLVQVTNTSAEARTLHPKLIVDTTLGLSVQGDRVMVKGEAIAVSLKMAGPPQGKQIPLEALAIPPGKTATVFAVYGNAGSNASYPATVDEALAARQDAIAYWKSAALPFDRIRVPDAGIQALVDASICNIWQAREIKKGLPAFQVGPTCYRGLWIVDGAFLLEAAAILGAGDQARNGVAYELTYQKPDGRIEVMKNYSKENGIVLWTCLRHAQLSQDKAWLESVWPQLLRIAEHIKSLRQATRANDSPLDDGLVPPGFPDGGLHGVRYEYTNPYWNLLGLRALAHAARWLGPGMVTTLAGIATPFGPLHLSVEVQGDGKAAALDVKPLAAHCKQIVVHLPGGTTRPIAPSQGGKIAFPVKEP